MTQAIDVERPRARFDILAAAEAAAPHLARGAEAADAGDRFVAENYAPLRDAGLMEAGVPAALGGGGAGVADLAQALRMLGRACGSTALAFAMHTHQVAIPAWRWSKRDVKAVEPLLRRVAAERIVLLSAGGGRSAASAPRPARSVSSRFIIPAPYPVASLAASAGPAHLPRRNYPIWLQ